MKKLFIILFLAFAAVSFSETAAPASPVSSREIIDYTYVTAKSLSDLAAVVKSYIKTGYQPYGPLMIQYKYGGDSEIFDVYIQLMVKYK